MLKALVIWFIGAIIECIAIGWALSWLWFWYVVPVFHLPEISIAAGFGISLIGATLLCPTNSLIALNQDTDGASARVILLTICAVIGAVLFVTVGFVGSGFVKP
jgi:hypothetical protein